MVQKKSHKKLSIPNIDVAVKEMKHAQTSTSEYNRHQKQKQKHKKTSRRKQNENKMKTDNAKK